MIWDESQKKLVKNSDIEISTHELNKLSENLQKRDFAKVQRFMSPV